MKKLLIFLLLVCLSTIPMFSQIVQTLTTDKEVKSTSVVQSNNAIPALQSFKTDNLFFKPGSLLLNIGKASNFTSLQGNEKNRFLNNTFARADYYLDVERNLLPLKFSNMIYYRIPRPRYEYSLIANY